MIDRARWILLGAIAILVLLIILGAHPFFAITKTSGSRVLVVEGWLDDASLERVAALVRKRGYEHVFTTGVVRPASYYLKQNEHLLAELPQPMEGELRLKAAGLPGTAFTLMAGTEPILISELKGDPMEFNALISPPSSSISIVEGGTPGDPTVDRAFIGGWWIDGQDVQQLAHAIFISRADGNVTWQGTTYAHLAAVRLEQLGIERGMITPVPTYGEPEGRTWNTAQDFIHHAEREGIGSFDVVTLGVHARRTRGLYRRAGGGAMEVGIIALPDHGCEPLTWWKHRYGWAKVLKEVVGAHQPYTAD